MIGSPLFLPKILIEKSAINFIFFIYIFYKQLKQNIMKFNNWSLKIKLYVVFGVLIIASLVIVTEAFIEFRDIRARVNRLDDFTEITKKTATWGAIFNEIIQKGDTAGFYQISKNVRDVKTIYEYVSTNIFIEENRILCLNNISELAQYHENLMKYLKVQIEINKLNDELDFVVQELSKMYNKNINTLPRSYLLANREIVKTNDAIYNFMLSGKSEYDDLINNYFNKFKEIVISQKIKEFEPHVELYSKNLAALKGFIIERSQLEPILQSSFVKIENNNTRMIDKIYVTIHESIKKSVRNLLIFSIICITLSIIIANVITKSMANVIKKCLATTEQVSEGNLDIKFDSQTLDRRDEFGQLFNAMNNMVFKLRNLIGGIIECASGIKDAGEVMNSGSQMLSHGATQQASSIEEVSSSMEEIAANIQQNSENAQQANEIASNMSEGIHKISKAASENYNQAKEISEKITIVNVIASQTNILALNAAVEAAHAGEHGRGFAVVASEVRKLAERSKDAANEITKLTNLIVKGVEETSDIMSITMPEVEKSIQLMKEIAISSAEQNSGTSQVNIAIQQMNNIAQQNAASSEEIATNAEELSSQADQLVEMASVFTI